MPLSPDRGSVWIVDLGMAAKIRPCLVIGVPNSPNDRVLVTVIPHTTSIQQTQYEVHIPKPFLKPGVFDAQQVVTIAQARLIKPIGRLTQPELEQVENILRLWLGL